MSERLTPSRFERGSSPLEGILERGRSVVEGLRGVFQSISGQRTESAARAGRSLLLGRRRFLGVVGAAGAVITGLPFVSEAAVAFQPVNPEQPIVDLNKDDVPPPTGPRTLADSVLVVNPETKKLSKNMHIMVDAVKKWVRPEFLQKYPGLDFTSLVDDLEKLKEYKEANYIKDVTLFHTDVRSLDDKVISFSVQTEEAGMFIGIYQGKDGEVYKIAIGVAIDRNGSLLSSKDGIPADQLPAVAEGIFDIKGVKLRWVPGQHAGRIGKGVTSDFEISASASPIGSFDLEVKNLKGSGSAQKLTSEQKAIREQQLKEYLNAEQLSLHNETRKPPVPDNSKPALTTEEEEKLSEDLSLITSAVRRWVSPRVLGINPELLGSSSVQKSEELKALRDNNRIREGIGGKNDENYIGFRFIEYSPFGEQGGSNIKIFVGENGVIHKAVIVLTVNEDYSLTSAYTFGSQPNRNVAPRGVEALLTSLYKLPAFDMKWEQGKLDDSVEGYGTAGLFVIKVEGSKNGLTRFTAEKKLPPGPGLRIFEV